jgi:hypothetical protein
VERDCGALCDEQRRMQLSPRYVPENLALVSRNVAPRVRRSCMYIMQPYGLHTYKVRTQACVVLQLVVAHPCRASGSLDRSRDDCPRVCFSQLPDHAAESDHVEPCFGARSDRRPDQRPRNTQGSSMARARVISITACLLMAYADMFGGAAWTKELAIATTEPLSSYLQRPHSPCS